VTSENKRGTVRFVGATQFAAGEWVGIELDDADGKNDGAVQGVRYFECAPQHGLFCPAAKVKAAPEKAPAQAPTPGTGRTGRTAARTAVTTPATPPRHGATPRVCPGYRHVLGWAGLLQTQTQTQTRVHR
jgi:hypothetical protein